MNTSDLKKAGGILLVGLMLSGCRGTISEKPPIHPNTNMDFQPRKEAQELNNFYLDGRSMRQPVDGTVARGLRKADAAYFEGVDENGDWIETMPVEVTRAFLYRGQERYDIFCTPCHGQVGDGKGIVTTGGYGYVPAPTYHQDRLREATDGELYSAIYNGVRTMPSYAQQIPVNDRWAIVAYIRALQTSQYVTEADIQSMDVDLDALKAENAAEMEEQAAAEAAKGESNLTPSVDLGKEVVTANGCAACHSTDGTSIIGPTWLNMFGSQAEVITESGEYETVTKDADYVHESIVKPAAKKTKGFETGVMVAYDYLSENEILSVIEYIKTLSDN